MEAKNGQFRWEDRYSPAYNQRKENTSLTVCRRIPQLDGHEDAEVQYHIVLCIQAKYLQDTKTVPFNGRCSGVGLLTWAGHEALDRFGSLL